MRWFSSAIAAVALAVAYLLIPAPIVSDNAFASKMNGSYGCSEGMGKCNGGDPNRSMITSAKKGNTKKDTK